MNHRLIGLTASRLRVLSRLRRPLAQDRETRHDADYFWSCQSKSLRLGGLTALRHGGGREGHGAKRRRRCCWIWRSHTNMWCTTIFWGFGNIMFPLRLLRALPLPGGRRLLDLSNRAAAKPQPWPRLFWRTCWSCFLAGCPVSRLSNVADDIVGHTAGSPKMVALIASQATRMLVNDLVELGLVLGADLSLERRRRKPVPWTRFLSTTRRSKGVRVIMKAGADSRTRTNSGSNTVIFRRSSILAFTPKQLKSLRVHAAQAIVRHSPGQNATVTMPAHPRASKTVVRQHRQVTRPGPQAFGTLTHDASVAARRSAEAGEDKEALDLCNRCGRHLHTHAVEAGWSVGSTRFLRSKVGGATSLWTDPSARW